MNKFVIIDGNAVVHRAFHALPPLTSPKGVVVNAVFGFCSFLLKTLKELKPEYVAATFDLAGPTFRHETFADYKAKRIKAPQELYDQLPLVKEILTAFGVPIYEKKGYEADDVIGTLVQLGNKSKDIGVVIATGDLDALQLVEGSKVTVFTLRKGLADTILYDQKAVKERYGLEPGQLVDYRGLKGDPSDNIPGVPGIGEKTASQLIQQFGTLEKLYDELEKAEKKKTKIENVSEKLAEKLLTNKDQAFFSKQLSQVVCDLDLDFSLQKARWRDGLARDEIERLFREYGFNSLIKRIDELSISQPDLLSASSTEQVAEVPGAKEMGGEREIEDFSMLARKKGALSLHVAGGQLALSCDGETRQIPLDDKNLKKLGDILEDPKIQKSGHDLKMVLKALRRAGIELGGLHMDTKIAAFMLSINVPGFDFPGLYHLAMNEVAPRDESLWPGLIARLAAEYEHQLSVQKLYKPYIEIELPLVPVLVSMEEWGIEVDLKAIKKLDEVIVKEIGELEKKIYGVAGGPFNINSPNQLSDVLFNKLGIKTKVRKTGGGALSTRATELEKMRGEHEIIDLISRYRELQKLKTTYIEPFPNFLAQDGRIHTTFNQTGAVTGRLSSQDPNLQNIPTKTELGQQFRRAFVAAKGFELMAFDYSQIDLRMVAHLAQDGDMIEAFNKGEDIHTRTACEVFGVKPEEVTRDMRRHAKVLNFGIVYGMGPVSFARTAGFSRQEAQTFIDRYFKEFSGVAKYLEEMKTLACTQGHIETLFGRRRLLPEINSTIPQVRAQAERMAVNMPIQGTAADIVKLAMTNVDTHLRKEGLMQDVRMLLQIHDELVFEIKQGVAATIAPAIKKIMESVYTLRVPLVVEPKIGNNWQEMKSYSRLQ